MLIKTPNIDRMTYEQRCHFFFIEDNESWCSVASKFTEEVEKFRYFFS